MKTLKLKVKDVFEKVEPSGNWHTAKDFFPTFKIIQETGLITITHYDTVGYQKYAKVESTPFVIKMSKNKDQVLITGEVDCWNFRHGKCSGTQAYCFAIFIGDSGHIYTHRATASKGWMNLDPEKIRKRLVKKGIGAVVNVLQQGDFLLKPAGINSVPEENFKHEWTSRSHHIFSEPLPSFMSNHGRHILIKEGEVELHHVAVDGIQHPTIKVPAGQWIIGSTSPSLRHANMLD